MSFNADPAIRIAHDNSPAKNIIEPNTTFFIISFLSRYFLLNISICLFLSTINAQFDLSCFCLIACQTSSSRSFKFFTFESENPTKAKDIVKRYLFIVQPPLLFIPILHYIIISVLPYWKFELSTILLANLSVLFSINLTTKNALSRSQAHVDILYNGINFSVYVFSRCNFVTSEWE